LTKQIDCPHCKGKITLKDRSRIKATVEPLLESEIKDPSKVIKFKRLPGGNYIQEGVEESKAMRIDRIE